MLWTLLFCGRCTHFDFFRQPFFWSSSRFLFLLFGLRRRIRRSSSRRRNLTLRRGRALLLLIRLFSSILISRRNLLWLSWRRTRRTVSYILFLVSPLLTMACRHRWIRSPRWRRHISVSVLARMIGLLFSLVTVSWLLLRLIWSFSWRRNLLLIHKSPCLIMVIAALTILIIHRPRGLIMRIGIVAIVVMVTSTRRSGFSFTVVSGGRRSRGRSRHTLIIHCCSSSIIFIPRRRLLIALLIGRSWLWLVPGLLLWLLIRRRLWLISSIIRLTSALVIAAVSISSSRRS